MALSTAVWVGEAKKWVPEMIEMAKKLKVSAGHEPGQILLPFLFKELYLNNQKFNHMFRTYYNSSLWTTKQRPRQSVFITHVLNDLPLCKQILLTLICLTGADLGPLISPEAKKRVVDLVNSGEKEGCEVLLDGRDCKVLYLCKVF